MMHIIVGIDFGYTQTGVAFSLLEAEEVAEPPRVIQKWPSQPNIVINKVPTKVAYFMGGSACTSWGFGVPPEAERDEYTVVAKHFKLYLDEEYYRQKYPDKPAIPLLGVRKWYTDFLTHLYDWIKKTLMLELPGSEDARIEYIFSVPTTWSPNIVERFREIINEVGFGNTPKLHTAITGLTEAEAAAVYTAVYDAKGFDTPGEERPHKYADVSIMEVASLKEDIPQLKQMAPVQGSSPSNNNACDEIGSVSIDEEFEKYVRQQLRHLGPADLDRVVEKMSEQFKPIKEQFGKDIIMRLRFVKFRVPAEMPANPKKQERLEIKISDITEWFNVKIKKITDLIDKQLKTLPPGKLVNYLILSGGLGSSVYVQEKLHAHYIQDNRKYETTRKMNVIIAQDPQLVVCRGLVLHRMLESLKISVISKRRSRTDFGIIFDEVYNRDNPNHALARNQRQRNPRDGNYYIPGKIHWLISKDEEIEEDNPPKQTFSYALDPKNEEKWLEHVIVKFDRPTANRPNDRNSPGVSPVCTIRCNIAPALRGDGLNLPRGARRKHRHNFILWKSGAFLKVEYDIRVYIGPADLRFEFWFNGELRSSVNDIEVDWEIVKTIAARPRDGGANSVSTHDGESEDDYWFPPFNIRFPTIPENFWTR
ncbi:hypothetical protein EDC01DRAFT_753098 [Geopyxis carbonaria]|nr:hypothetical protein EDC01DRAFT_753098 [Geopyxis carbonaria]